MTQWWGALAPVGLPVHCGALEHELRWAEGRLTAPGHPQAERERALAALGAEPAPCVQILDAWKRHLDDLDVLVLGSRGANDPLLTHEDADVSIPRPGRRGLQGYAALSQTAAYSSSLTVARKAGWSGFGGRHGGMPRRYADYAPDQPVGDVAMLLSLGSGLPQRLTATVIATWAERIEAGDDRVVAATPTLDAALYGRLRAALLPWLGRSTTIRLTMLPPGGSPVLRHVGEVTHAELPFAWLRNVWANDLAVLLDRFTLSADVSPSGGWMLRAVDRALGAPIDVTISG